MVHYDLNKIKLAFDAQYKTVMFTHLLTYLLTYLVALASKTSGLALALKMLVSNPSLIIVRGLLLALEAKDIFLNHFGNVSLYILSVIRNYGL